MNGDENKLKVQDKVPGLMYTYAIYIYIAIAIYFK